VLSTGFSTELQGPAARNLGAPHNQGWKSGGAREKVSKNGHDCKFLMKSAERWCRLTWQVIAGGKIR
jgi:hypothetical protein